MVFLHSNFSHQTDFYVLPKRKLSVNDPELTRTRYDLKVVLVAVHNY